MKASEWIDRLKQAKGWDSDYRVSKELGLSRQTVSKYRSGTSSTMDEESAVKVAGALGEAPEVVLLDQVVERSHNEQAKTALGGLLKRLGGVAAGLCMAVGVVSAPSPAEARTATTPAADSASSVYYVNLKKWRRAMSRTTVRISKPLRPSPFLKPFG